MTRQAIAALLAGAWTLGCAGRAAPEPPRPREGRTASGLAFEVRGHGPAVVLVHGAMLDRRMWDPQRPLESCFTIIRYDTRWHGRSAGALGPFRAADDLAEVLDAAGVDRAAVIGLSNGARIAVDFALQYPGRVTRVVLASPGVTGYVPVERPDFWVPLAAALRAGDADSAARVLAASPVMAVGDGDTAWVRAMVREQAGVFRQDPSLEVRPAALERLGDITLPVLIITGDDDLRDIRLAADTIQARVHGAHRISLAGQGHLLNISAAPRFNALVAQFLAVPEAR